MPVETQVDMQHAMQHEAQEAPGDPQGRGTLAARLRQQAAVAALGLRALGGVGRASLLQEAVEAVGETLGTEFVKVLELAADGSAMQLVAGIGWHEGVVGHATEGVGHATPAGYALQSDAPVLVDDLRAETRFSSPTLLHDHGIVSGLSVPIAGADGRPFGTLGAHTAEPRVFTADDAHFLQAVANVLAAALQRRQGEDARLSARAEAEALSVRVAETNGQMRVAVDRAERLLAVSAGLNAASSPADVADVIFREGLVALGADAGALALVHEGDAEAGESAEFEIVRTVGYPEPLTTRYRRFPLVAGRPLSDAVVTRTPRLLGSWAEWKATYPDVDADVGASGYEAFVAIPVLSGGRVRAALSASFRHAVAFTEETRTFLATLGEQCGLALARAQASEAERRAREASAFLAEASRLLAASLDYATTLRTVAEAAVPRLGDWCAVDIVRDPTVPTWPPELDRVAVVHRDPAKLALGAELMARYPTDWSRETGMAGVLRTGMPLLVPTITDAMLVAGARDADHLAMLRALEFSSFIVVPLIARGRTLGALTLCHTESGRRYDAADLALAEDLAQRAALAVDNARLYRDAERARALAEEARRTAEEASRAKGDFLAVMSHELRTPLNAIGGHVQLLEMGLHGPVTEEQRSALERVGRAQHHLLALINDILNYTRVERGRVEYDVQPVLVADVVREVRPMIEPQLTAKQLTLDVQMPDPADAVPLPVWADRDKLVQVLLNLLSNAVKFTPAARDGRPGRVTVTLSTAPNAAPGRDGLSSTEPHAPVPSPSHVYVQVADTGVGIPSDKLAQVFEPFVQVRTALTREVGGTGLGLAISRDLARGMGGDLWAASTEGEGSTFTLMLRRVVDASGEPVDRRTGDERRVDEERRSGEERRDGL